MEYDFENAVLRTCSPPQLVSLHDHATARLVNVVAAKKKDVDSLALAEALTPSQVWDTVNAKFYSGENREIVRGLTRAQVLKRVHDTRYACFGGDIHGRIEVAPLSKVNSQLEFFQFHHIWHSKARNEKKRDGVDRVIGWSVATGCKSQSRPTATRSSRQLISPAKRRTIAQSWPDTPQQRRLTSQSSSAEVHKCGGHGRLLTILDA